MRQNISSFQSFKQLTVDMDIVRNKIINGLLVVIMHYCELVIILINVWSDWKEFDYIRELEIIEKVIVKSLKIGIKTVYSEEGNLFLILLKFFKSILFKPSIYYDKLEKHLSQKNFAISSEFHQSYSRIYSFV